VAWIYIYIWLFKMVTCGCIRWHTHTYIYIYIYIYIYVYIYIRIYIYIPYEYPISIHITMVNQSHSDPQRAISQPLTPPWPWPSLCRRRRSLRQVTGDGSKCGTKDRRKLRKWLLNVLNRAGFVWLRFMMFYMYSYVNLSGNYQQISSCFHPFMSIYHHVILYDIMCCHLL